MTFNHQVVGSNPANPNIMVKVKKKNKIYLLYSYYNYHNYYNYIHQFIN